MIAVFCANWTIVYCAPTERRERRGSWAINICPLRGRWWNG